MSDKIKRYDIDNFGEMFTDKLGEYVEYDDHLNKITTLKKEKKNLLERCQAYEQLMYDYVVGRTDGSEIVKYVEVRISGM